MTSNSFNVAFVFVLPVLLLVAGVWVDPPRTIATGLWRIITSPSVLLTDYLEVGGRGATLVNAALCGIVSCLMVLLFRLDFNGPFIAAVYTVIAFAFFGKNILNIWPIFAGVALYARFQKVPFRNYALVALFGTTLAPLVSYIAFGSWMNGLPGLGLAVAAGILVGFLLPPLATHMLQFHAGFNIYNIGFTGGIIGSFFIAIMRGFHFEVSTILLLSTDHDLFFKILLNTFFLCMVAVGLVLGLRQPHQLRDALKKIHASSGRLVSDFTQIGDYPSTLVNMGVMGLITSVYVVLLGGQFNGPTIGGILTVVGFAAFGKHARNSCPVMLGVYLASLVKVWETNATGVVIAGLFGTTLAPVTGQYGLLAGIAAGFCHLSIVMNVAVLHGGVNLYNNGFSGGFVASFLVPILDAFKRDTEE